MRRSRLRDRSFSVVRRTSKGEKFFHGRLIRLVHVSETYSTGNLICISRVSLRETRILFEKFALFKTWKSTRPTPIAIRFSIKLTTIYLSRNRRQRVTSKNSVKPIRLFCARQPVLRLTYESFSRPTSRWKRSTQCVCSRIIEFDREQILVRYASRIPPPPPPVVRTCRSEMSSPPRATSPPAQLSEKSISMK